MKGKHDTVKRERSTETAERISIELPELEKYHEIVETRKNTAATKGNEVHDKHMTKEKSCSSRSKSHT